MFAIFLFFVVFIFFNWLIYQPDTYNCKLSKSPAPAYINSRTNIRSYEALSYTAKSDRHPFIRKGDSVLLTVSIEVPNGGKLEQTTSQNNLATILVANGHQSSGNGNGNGNGNSNGKDGHKDSNGNGHSPMVTVSIEVPKGQEFEKASTQNNLATILVANGHQSSGNGNDNNNGNSNGKDGHKDSNGNGHSPMVTVSIE
ncbi:MAG: hypothetical protein WBA93_23860, partial [Microcoleaceae cyanobacterium]